MPKQIGDMSLQSLRKYDGRDPFMPLLLAVRGKVYDVTEGKDFYGVGEEQEQGLVQRSIALHYQL